MEDLLVKYQKGIRAFIAQRIEDEEVISELTNDVMMAVHRSAETFEGRSEEFSWICGIAKHKIVDYLRKKKIKTILFSVNPKFEDIADMALMPERDVLKEELKQEIKKTLRELGAGYGKILRLKYVQGRKTAAIAKILKTSVKAVESKLRRAKMSFRSKWTYDKKTAREFASSRRTNRP